MATAPVDSPLRRNPVFWIVWLIPAATVVAGLTTLGIALRSADHPLPPAYHWEGERLDRDFALARNAATHGIEMTFKLDADALACSAALRKAPDDPATLTLLFTNGSDAGLDRVVLMKRVEAGQYRGTCGPLPAGRWRLAIEDAAGAWALRDEFNGRVDQLELRAHDPGAGA
jgi:hypothetical protein